MFDRGIPRSLRALSLFHGGLPLLLLLMVHRLGYDERALIAQTTLAIILLPLSYWVSDLGKNINWVYGWAKSRRPEYLRAGRGVSHADVSLAIYLPTHFVLDRIFSSAPIAPHHQTTQDSVKQ